ncbi:hypothetical protein [Calidithermus chliarophilus]|uniref:hypothetical protein n=1 Tax=Calidithermus chliarophilus TaxID=52023 RepID=UPI0003F92487|nr:hypothetical protein [Calidithermus chliarophilus]
MNPMDPKMTKYRLSGGLYDGASGYVGGAPETIVTAFGPELTYHRTALIEHDGTVVYTYVPCPAPAPAPARPQAARPRAPGRGAALPRSPLYAVLEALLELRARRAWATLAQVARHAGVSRVLAWLVLAGLARSDGLMRQGRWPRSRYLLSRQGQAEAEAALNAWRKAAWGRGSVIP